MPNLPEVDHRTSVEENKRVSAFWPVCTCGWRDAPFTLHGLAQRAADAHSDEMGTPAVPVTIHTPHHETKDKDND